MEELLAQSGIKSLDEPVKMDTTHINDILLMIEVPVLVRCMIFDRNQFFLARSRDDLTSTCMNWPNGLYDKKTDYTPLHTAKRVSLELGLNITSFADKCILHRTTKNAKCVSLTLLAVDYESIVTNSRSRWVTEQEIEEARWAKRTKIQPTTMSELQIGIHIRNQYITHQRQARITFNPVIGHFIKHL